jgi:acyl carrier protein
MNLETKIIALVSVNTPSKMPVSLASDLRKELQMDSFGTLMILNAIEDELGVTVEDADFCQVQTVADIITLLKSKYHCAG